MIEVFQGKFEGHTSVLVDADQGALIGQEDRADANLVLEKDGIEVAWFQSWAYAVKVDNLMEYIDEQ